MIQSLSTYMITLKFGLIKHTKSVCGEIAQMVKQRTVECEVLCSNPGGMISLTNN